MKILIKVTKEILEKTKYCNGINNMISCAIAEAVRSIFPKATVMLAGISLEGYEELYSVSYPESSIKFTPGFIPNSKETKDFINAFDEATPGVRAKMDPYSFEIELHASHIEVLLSQISLGKIYKELSESSTLELIHP